MSKSVNLSPSLRYFCSKVLPLAPQNNISSQNPGAYSRPRKFLRFPGKISVFSHGLRSVDALKHEGSLRELDDSPVSVELLPICSESQFDRVMAEAQQLQELVVIVWMASWCRKCIYLKPKLEKLAAEYYPRLQFYHVDVNSVPYKLVSRAGVMKMPTIQLWRDCEKKDEIIGGHKAHLVIDEVREMIEKVFTS